jgi:hypothetical protein
MFFNLTNVLLLLLAAGLFYWLAPRVVAAFKRFDAENRSRIEDEMRDRRDRNAHIRHTLAVAGEQVEEITEVSESDPRTGTPVVRYVFEGERYATRDEAEKVRAEKIGRIAMGFYQDLPRALTARRGDGRLG